MLPNAQVIHTDPDAPASAEQKPLPPGVSKAPSKAGPAAWAYKRLILYIQNFEETLDNEHEVAMGFTGGDVGTMRIEGIGFFDPDLITFYGSDPTGSRVQLVQHVSQLNVMLRTLPKEPTRSEARRIGFRLAAALEKEEA